MAPDASGESSVVSDCTLRGVFDRDEEEEKGRETRRCTRLRTCVLLMLWYFCPYVAGAVSLSKPSLHAREIKRFTPFVDGVKFYGRASDTWRILQKLKRTGNWPQNGWRCIETAWYRVICSEESSLLKTEWSFIGVSRTFCLRHAYRDKFQPSYLSTNLATISSSGKKKYRNNVLFISLTEIQDSAYFARVYEKYER